LHQIRTCPSGPIAIEAVWLLRTHWNVNVSYYRDRTQDISTSVLLTQLHLYL
jgi:hypothetical protein